MKTELLEQRYRELKDAVELATWEYEYANDVATIALVAKQDAEQELKEFEDEFKLD